MIVIYCGQLWRLCKLNNLDAGPEDPSPIILVQMLIGIEYNIELQDNIGFILQEHRTVCISSKLLTLHKILNIWTT